MDVGVKKFLGPIWSGKRILKDRCGMLILPTGKKSVKSLRENHGGVSLVNITSLTKGVCMRINPASVPVGVALTANLRI